MLSSSSIAICPHTPALPVYLHESFSHVSLPNSPSAGMVWKIHRRLPVRTSKPRMKPFTLVLLRGTPPGRCAAPMTTTFLADQRRRVQSDFAGDEIDLLVVVLLQIDDAVLAEAGHRDAGLRVERDEPVAGRDVENPLLAAVGPVGQAAAGQQPRRVRAARALRSRRAPTAVRRWPRRSRPPPAACRPWNTGRRSPSAASTRD